MYRRMCKPPRSRLSHRGVVLVWAGHLGPLRRLLTEAYQVLVDDDNTVNWLGWSQEPFVVIIPKSGQKLSVLCVNY